MSTISASTTTTTAYKVTADTTGTLVLQTGATPTTAVTIDTSQNVAFAKGFTVGATAAPAFSASVGSAQSIAANTYTKVPFNTKQFDTNSNFDTTNYRFLPTVAGYYLFTTSTNIAQNSGFQVIFLYKNGTQYAQLQLVSGNASVNQTLAASAIVAANGTTDYFEIYAYQASGGTVNMNTGGLFTGAMIRSA